MGTEHYVYRRDGKVYLYQVGGGEPIIFLHAAGQSGWFWRNCVDGFARQFTCHVVDLPGFDHSDIPPRHYSMDDYVDAIMDVIDSIGLEQTHVVADHTGALIGLILAGKHPERVRRMVLDGLPFWNRRQGQIIFEKSFTPMYTDETSYHIPVVPLNSWKEAQAKTPGIDRNIWKKTEEIKRRSQLWSRLSHEAHTNYDVEAASPRVKSPTLLIYGDGDRVARAAGRAKAGIKGSTLEIVDKSPGAAHLYQPDQFVRLAIEFLKAKEVSVDKAGGEQCGVT